MRAGLAADLALFDPATVQDEATFADPHRHPAGIPYVIVNGRVVVDGAALHTRCRPAACSRLSSSRRSCRVAP